MLRFLVYYNLTLVFLVLILFSLKSMVRFVNGERVTNRMRADFFLRKDGFIIVTILIISLLVAYLEMKLSVAMKLSGVWLLHLVILRVVEMKLSVIGLLHQETLLKVNRRLPTYGCFFR